MEEAGIAPGSIDVAVTEVSLSQSVNVAVNRQKNLKRFMKFVEKNPDLIGKNEQNEMIVEGKTLEGSNIDDPLRNMYVQTLIII